jgi:hypothetical protein
MSTRTYRSLAGLNLVRFTLRCLHFRRFAFAILDNRGYDDAVYIARGGNKLIVPELRKNNHYIRECSEIGSAALENDRVVV